MKKIAEATIVRLSIYNRTLHKLEREGVEIISSFEMGDKIGFSAAQIRKDLSFFGDFGETGKGYYVRDLINAISRILGVDRKWDVVLVGAGNLGAALFYYPEFGDRGFNIVVVFDNDLRKIGKRLENIVIQDISELPKTVKELNIRIGIITVPAQVSQGIANLLTSSGVRAILNFAPSVITVPEGMELRNVGPCTKLESLTYFLTNDAKVRTDVFMKTENSSGY
ncbi:redox-sensing transcriptional repressor Rex [Candidatus Latescibacterota bacterium]